MLLFFLTIHPWICSSVVETFLFWHISVVSTHCTTHVPFKQTKHVFYVWLPLHVFSGCIAIILIYVIRFSYTRPAFRQPDTSSADSPGTSSSCTCPSHSRRRSCSDTRPSWSRCAWRSLQEDQHKHLQLLQTSFQFLWKCSENAEGWMTGI